MIVIVLGKLNIVKLHKYWLPFNTQYSEKSWASPFLNYCLGSVSKIMLSMRKPTEVFRSDNMIVSFPFVLLNRLSNSAGKSSLLVVSRLIVSSLPCWELRVSCRVVWSSLFVVVFATCHSYKFESTVCTWCYNVLCVVSPNESCRGSVVQCIAKHDKHAILHSRIMGKILHFIIMLGLMW